MAHRMLQENNGEEASFPIVCETCLGPNPYVRMQKIPNGGACHISGRPYTVFRWRPGNDARYKKTIICQEVAKAKNVCQVCLFDLDYGLPVQVRDTALGIEKDEIPESAVGKEYQLNEQVKAGETESSFAGAGPSNDMLQHLARTTPYYKRNQARVCSFFVRGACTRGAECPYRHEMPTSGPLSEQNIKDRYYGINDPVAAKLLSRYEERGKLTPPEDTSVATLYVGGLTPEITENDLRDAFYSYGEITSVRRVETRFCAFVTFAARAGAEKAAEELSGRLIVKGTRLKLMWGRPQQAAAGGGAPVDPSMQPVASSSGVPGAYGGPPAYFGLAPPGAMAYPSMDPTAIGARLPAPGDKRGGGGGGGGDKRARTDGAAAGAAAAAAAGGGGGSGFGHPGFMPMGPPPPMMMRPPGMMGMPMMMGMGMGAPPMGPPRPMAPPWPRPPAGAPPAAAPAPAAAGGGGPPAAS
ncbi:hypothetical protein Rsub_04265 [Raphidocelis subcapitata]|uniref:Pre-mRNA-splicing factor n=1 Tax=Raphidocelis subcapitata TaxID=307507 RepID=A0A2V0P377_9CHLO|nr:hypothetical protein Rsub_04265 [Raphidocelis subcapitata]|eukprot:GBF91525.1 hypothetical protein Rsub_04265 [Raphidocelis subcapitata]